MRLSCLIVSFALALALSGCARQESRSAESAGVAVSESAAPANADSRAQRAELDFQRVSLNQAEPPQQATTERKIIRDAELSIETPAPAEGQRKLASIAEANGGFVVTSEAQQRGSSGGNVEIVNMQLRVPAARFEAALGEIRAIGERVRSEKITGKDVTEEFIDLEARLRTQRALEAQFLEIMKQASKVSDALEVNRQLAEVRNEIERVDGRRRFLQNQASLSTIKVTLQTPAPLVGSDTSGFFHSLKEAFGDGIDVAVWIILTVVRVGIALIPVAVLVALPLYLLWRWLRRRVRRTRLKEAVAAAPGHTN